MPDMHSDALQNKAMRMFGLIGYPLTHSFSEKFFSEKFEREALTNCRYDLYPIKSIDEIKQILRFSPNIEGLNVTVPYKQQVLRYLNSTSNIPEGVRACNCIKIEKGKLIGYNTDCIGFEKSFTPLLKPHHKKALVLGNGGAAEAIIFVLKKLNIDFAVVSRVFRHGSDFTYKDVVEKKLKEYSIIINTTPVGMFPDENACPDIPYDFITEKHLLYDLVYNPAKTLFLQRGEEKGASIKNGEEMLAVQAEESWEIWNS